MTLDAYVATTPGQNGKESEPGGPRWWLNRMSLLLNARVGRIQMYRDYYEGRHTLHFADKKFREAFGSLFKDYAENICELVVDSVAERLHVTGFRMGSKLNQENVDADAWDIWQANQLDAQSQIAHKTSLVEGESFIGVWSNPKDPKHPLMRVLDPRSTIVIHGYEDPLERRAAFRRWRDDWTGRVFATVYLPEATYKYQASSGFAPVVPPIQPEDAERIQWGLLAGWEERKVPGEPWPLPNPLGVVPIVPLINKPTYGLLGISEIATTIPINNAINKLVSDMLVSAAFAGFPQRWGINLPLVENAETGMVEFSNLPIDPGSDRLWAFGPTSPGEAPIQFGEFSAANLDNFVKAIEQRLQIIATMTRTPHHYILGGQGSFPSGEALRAVETPLVSKARDKMNWLGEAWEEAIRLAFKVLGDPRGEIMNSETVWEDPENHSEAQRVDSLLKMGALGVPREVLWERWGASPVEIERWKALLAQGAAAGTPTGLPPVVGTGANAEPGMGGMAGAGMRDATAIADQPPPGVEVSIQKVRA